MCVAGRINDIDSLATRMLALEEEAFNEFASVFGPRFRAFFVRRGLTAMDAEDLAVSCVTDIALKVEKFRSVTGGGFEAWVFTLARRALFDWWRQRQETVPLSEDLPAPSAEEEDVESDPGVIAAVREALGQLPESEQKLVMLRNLGPEHTYADLSAQLGVTPEAARVRHFRAMKRLKSILENDPRIQKLLERSNPTEEKKLS